MLFYLFHDAESDVVCSSQSFEAVIESTRKYKLKKDLNNS